jgi:copper chaperone
MVKQFLDIKGMHCKSCAKLIESELQEKVNNIKVEESGKAMIDFDESKITLQQIKDTIKELGYKA